MCAPAWGTHEPQCECCCSARNSLHLCCGLSGTGEGFVVLSAYGSCSSSKVSLLIGRSLDADVNVVFAGDRGRLVMANVVIKSFKFQVAAVYVPNIAGGRTSSFQRLIGPEQTYAVKIDPIQPALDSLVG